MGSLKAGLTIVNSEFEDWADVKQALRDSEADILVVSPHKVIENDTTRIDEIMKDLPEMNDGKFCQIYFILFYLVQPGDYLRSSNFPDLKQVIQISHKTIPGTQKFKVIFKLKF
jgi:hypothetical protein